MDNYTIEYQWRIVQIVTYDVTFPNGKIKRFEKVMRAPGVRLIFDDDWKILLNKEWRNELGCHDLRLPGGKVFDTLQEYLSFVDEWWDLETAAIQAACIEWREEVWYEITFQDVKAFARKLCGATTERDLWYVVATAFKDLWHGSAEDISEHDEWVFDGYNRYTYDEVLKLIAQWEIKEARSAGVLAQYILSD